MSIEQLYRYEADNTRLLRLVTITAYADNPADNEVISFWQTNENATLNDGSTTFLPINFQVTEPSRDNTSQGQINLSLPYTAAPYANFIFDNRTQWDKVQPADLAIYSVIVDGELPLVGNEYTIGPVSDPVVFRLTSLSVTPTGVSIQASSANTRKITNKGYYLGRSRFPALFA